MKYYVLTLIVGFVLSCIVVFPVYAMIDSGIDRYNYSVIRSQEDYQDGFERGQEYGHSEGYKEGSENGYYSGYADAESQYASSVVYYIKGDTVYHAFSDCEKIKNAADLCCVRSDCCFDEMFDIWAENKSIEEAITADFIICEECEKRLPQYYSKFSDLDFGF